jgi:hypothetical protein
MRRMELQFLTPRSSGPNVPSSTRRLCNLAAVGLRGIALRDSAALARIAIGGRQLVEEKLSVSAMVDAYERLYLKAIRR